MTPLTDEQRRDREQHEQYENEEIKKAAKRRKELMAEEGVETYVGLRSRRYGNALEVRDA